MSTETETKPLTHYALRKFCGEGGLTYDDRRPFARDGFCWATDAVILVRIPLETVNSVPRPGEVPYPDVLAAWTGKTKPVQVGFNADAMFVTWEPPRDIESDLCWVCGADGRMVCTECNDESRCPCCYGVGKVYWPRTLMIGTAKIQTRYYELIGELPSPTFVIPGPGEDQNAISFRFDGGEGLLMPLGKDDSDDK
jgi:hypothetical protein